MILYQNFSLDCMPEFQFRFSVRFLVVILSVSDPILNSAIYFQSDFYYGFLVRFYTRTHMPVSSSSLQFSEYTPLGLKLISMPAHLLRYENSYSKQTHILQ